MIQQIESAVQRCREFFQITAGQSQHLGFPEWQQIPTKQRGIYVIYDQAVVIYVGKGLVRDRQDKHWQKAQGEFRDARDTLGWRWLREHTEVAADSWRMLVITGLSHTQCSALEGALIHVLQPLANDEVYLDRKGR